MAVYTRIVTIGGVTFTDSATKISFSWGMHGCEKATIQFEGQAFDQILGIEQEDDVIISYSSGDEWWRGIVDEINTSVDGMLTIECTGSKALLSEVIPAGRYGTKIETTAPTLTTTAEAAADTGAPGAEVQDYGFIVTAFDAEGETYAGTSTSGNKVAGTVIEFEPHTVTAVDKKVTVAWTASTNGAKGYRVYMNNNLGTAGVMTLAEKTKAGGLVFYDVVGTSFVYDGSLAGEGKDFPFTVATDRTSIQKTIANTKIQDIVIDIIDTYKPSELTRGSVSIGTLNVDVDVFDLNKNSADMQKVLDSLVALAGDVQWWVDEDNKIQFQAKSTTITAARTYTTNKTGDVLTGSTNVLVGATKRSTRDGITHIKVEGEEALEEGANNPDLGVTWDDTTFSTVNDASVVRATADPRFHSIASPQGANRTVIPSGSGFAYVDGFATLQLWLNDHPNLRWIYLVKDDIASAAITKYFSDLRDRMNLRTGVAVEIRARPRVVTKRFPGIRTARSSGLVGTQWLLRHTPNPVRWTVLLQLVDTFLKPGQGNIRVTTDAGTRYDIPMQSIDYAFDETVAATITAGDEEYEQCEEDDDSRDIAVATSMRKSTPTRWCTSS